MNMKIDFSKGGYQGDIIEETFKPITAPNMPFWWHFREVLRASQAAQAYWKQISGPPLPVEGQRELVALSLMNYAVYTGIAEAIAFFEQMSFELAATKSEQWRVFEVRRLWKAFYSSLYTSLNALCNLVCILVGQKSPWGNDPNRVWNYTPKEAYNLVSGRGIKVLAEPINRCRDRLEIRDHLDHYWTIWLGVNKGVFMMDENFQKGYVSLHPNTEVRLNVDARKLAETHYSECLSDYNLVYYEMAVQGGFLDKYLLAKGWEIDYTDLGSPHSGKRPTP